MSDHLLNVDYFLNRLAINEMANPKALDPYKILKEIFRDIYPEEMKESFNHFCSASLSEKYCWKEGKPGNLLYFSELLEQIVEACFLIYYQPESIQEKCNDDSSNSVDSKYNQSLAVIANFFDTTSLPEWKIALHYWTMAGLSDYSIVENVTPSEILSFVRYVEKLIEAAYRITVFT